MTPAYQIAIGLGVCVGLFFLAASLPRLVAAARECLHLRARGRIYGWPWWWSTARRRRRLAEIRTGGARPKLAEACAKLWPTLTSLDDKGPGPAHTKSGIDLPQALGGHLNPEWALWYMGFPEGWLDVPVERSSARSATRARRSKRKSRAT